MDHIDSVKKTILIDPFSNLTKIAINKAKNRGNSTFFGPEFSSTMKKIRDFSEIVDKSCEPCRLFW